LFGIAGIVQDDVNFVLVLEFLLNFTKEISDRIAVYFLVRACPKSFLISDFGIFLALF
jgi:hypothetical protein